MTKLGTALLEIVRMMIIMTLFVGLLGKIEISILSGLIVWNDHYSLWLLGGNMLIFFVLYRNKLQFKGWYRSNETQKKLSVKITRVCVSAAILLTLAPLFISWMNMA